MPALVGVVFAHESEPQAMHVEDRAALYDGAEYDTDWMPADSPLAVRFQVEATGGATVSMDGTASLTWPEALTLALAGEPGTGVLAVDSTLSAVTSVRFDVAGYSWESEIDRRTLEIASSTVFDPFSLGEIVTLDWSGEAETVIEYSADVFTGVSLVFSADVRPEASASYVPLRWTVEDEAIESEDEAVVLEPEGGAERDVSAVLTGTWGAGLDLVITPTMEVCVDVAGCWELASFDISVPLTSTAFAQDAPPVDLSFPVPVMDLDVEPIDFGEVDVGDVAVFELPIASAGALPVDGVAGLLGSDAFSAWPETFRAEPGETDGVVVMFAPAAEGAAQGTLVLESNDPERPLVEIALSGTGVSPSTDGEGEAVSGGVRACGCAGVPGSRGAGALALVLAGLAAAAMRRRPGAR